jgi:hypothetical protein
MTATVRGWRIDLIKAYPNLFHPPAGVPQAARGYPECGDGWSDLLNSACAKIAGAIGERDSFTVLQIKERFAVLRVYWQGSVSTEAEAKIVDAVGKAEARAACTCSLCGEEGRLYRADRVLTTRCALHANGQPVEFPTGLENVHIVRRIIAGRCCGITCCRYVRAADAFIDLLPDASGAEIRGGTSSWEGAGHG